MSAKFHVCQKKNCFQSAKSVKTDKLPKSANVPHKTEAKTIDFELG